MRKRYIICIKRNENEEVYHHCCTYQEIADTINTTMGYKIVSKAVVTNWLSRDKKSGKYDFVTIQ